MKFRIAEIRRFVYAVMVKKKWYSKWKYISYDYNKKTYLLSDDCYAPEVMCRTGLEAEELIDGYKEFSTYPRYYSYNENNRVDNQ